MNKNGIRVVLPLAAACASLISMEASASRASARLSVAGLMNYNFYSETITTDAIDIDGTGDLGFGGGFLGSLGVGSVGVEFGALYFTRQVNLDAPGDTPTDVGFPLDRQEQFHFPLLVRLGDQNLVSFGAGVFYEEPIGQGRRNNYGLEGGIRLNLPAQTATRFFIDARFARGIPAQGNQAVGEFKTNDLFILAGLAFGN